MEILAVGEEGKYKDSDRPVCRICFSEVSAKWGNTSNLYTHLQKKHPDKYLEVKVKPTSSKANDTTACCSKSEQQTMEQCLARTQLIKTNSTEHKRITKAVTRFLAKDMIPLYQVDKSGFREMIQAINPRYQLPHKDYFNRVAIPSLYDEISTDVKKAMADNTFYFSGTTDLWSSCTMEPYLSYTVHYITDDWTFRSHCLQAHFMPESHTGTNLQDALSSTLQEWNLDDSRQVAITTDNASNVKLACQLLKWRQLSCFDHNLDLAIKKSLSDQRVERVLRLCCHIVSAFSCSWTRAKTLADVQQQRGLPLKKLKGDVSTRWGSTSSMLERIKKQLDAIRIVLGNDRKASHLMPTWQDCDVIDSVIVILSPLHQLTDLLSSDKRVTCSVIKPLIKHIFESILSDKEEDTTLTQEMKSVIKQDLQNRYSGRETSTFLDLCSFLGLRDSIVMKRMSFQKPCMKK